MSLLSSLNCPTGELIPRIIIGHLYPQSREARVLGEWWVGEVPAVSFSPQEGLDSPMSLSTGDVWDTVLRTRSRWHQRW